MWRKINPKALLTPLLMGFAMMLTTPGFLKAQELNASLSFEEDSLVIGRPISVRMAIQHPSDVVVIFPEPREFAPFELVSSAPKPTQTLDGNSWDIVVYQVRSFLLDDYQALKLPYAYYQGNDTIRKFVKTDSIKLIRRVLGGEDRTQFKMQEGLESLDDPPNYFRIFLLFSGIISLLLGFLLLMRKPIKRYLIIRRNRLDWLTFKRRLKELEGMHDQPKLFNKLNQLWKGYLDPEDKSGYRSMTTTEFREALLTRADFTLEQQQALIEAAQLADQAVYAGERIPPHRITNILIQIKNVMGYVYANRAKALKKKKE